MKGFLFPRTATGIASILPDPPWHYSGTMLTLEYRTDISAVEELLPAGFSLADEDPGAVALIWADWQSCSNSYAEILDPIRAQYKEALFVIRCKFEDIHYSRCVYIWVDTDYSMVRGHHQGYPKRLGSIFLSRPISVGRAGPKLESGGTFGATLAAYDRRLAEAKFTITEPCETAGFVNSHPMLHNRWVPAIESNGVDSLSELVTMTGFDVEIGRSFTGSFELTLGTAPTEEFCRLVPRELLNGYWREIGFSWKSGITLRRSNLPGK